MKTIGLVDGTHLAERLDGLFVWHPDERVVRAVIAGGAATLTTTDDPPEPLATISVVEEAPGKAAAGRKAGGTARERPGPRPGRSEDATRWDTLNEFEDEIAPHLTLSEQAVWHYLFRHCRHGKTSASTRGIADAKGLAPNTVTSSLRWMKDRGLVWEITKSTHRGAASVYGMHAHPGQLAAACEAANRPRLARRKRVPIGRRKPR